MQVPMYFRQILPVYILLSKYNFHQLNYYFMRPITLYNKIKLFLCDCTLIGLTLFGIEH